MNYELRIKPGERGQTLLIVVLVMVVALTVSLSVASRSIVSVRTTTEEENSQRAFSAAEAGIERAIKTQAEITSVSLGNNSSIVKAVPTTIGGTAFNINNGAIISEDDGADIWFSNQDYSSPKTTSLTIYWGNTTVSDCSNAALEIVVLSGTSVSNAVARRYAYDPCSTRNNNFSSPASTGNYTISGTDVHFKYQTQAIGITNGFIARVIPLYADSQIGVISSISLPIQGTQVVSTGASGETQRQVKYFQGYRQIPPEFFQYILFQP